MARRQRDYRAERARRRELARARGLSTSQARGHPRRGELPASKVRAPRAPKQLATATPAQLEFRGREANALSALRRGEVRNLTEAQKAFGLPRGSLRRDMPSAFDVKGRVKSSDREAVRMLVIGPNGDELVTTRGSGARRLVAQHRHAVRGFLEGRLTEDELRKKFFGKRVGGVELETDGDRLRALYELGRTNSGPYPETEMS